MTRLGYQIPNFTYPQTPTSEIFDKVVAQAKAAERAGYDRVMVMDHFYQLPGIGKPDEPMFECYAMLSALAQHTESVRLAALVTGNTYRNPTLLAKTITTLDHVSKGRATLAGKHYSVENAINSPPPISKIPIMIGGQGEKKTLRMVAQYADESNLTGEVKDIPRKLEVLAEHCERLGRDRAEIAVTKLLMIVVAPTHEEVEADLAEIAAVKGWNDGVMDRLRKALIFGDADSVGERIAEAVGMGLDGITVDLPVNGHKTERFELLGQIALRALDAR